MKSETRETLILIVDDSPINATILKTILTRQGYSVIRAKNGLVGLEMAERHIPDLILLDLEMPVLDGYEVCRSLKNNEKLKQIPILIVSALSQISSKVSCFELGAADYITKPFKVEEVVARVKSQLNLAMLTSSLMSANEKLVEKQKALEIDLQSASEIQKALLPTSLPDYKTIAFVSFFYPCEKVGGDLFNVQRLDEHKLGIYIMDVSGHGVPAAMITALVYQTMNINSGKIKKKIPSPPWYSITDPVEVMKMLDTEFPLERFDRYLTMFYLILDIRDGSFTYTSAGHPPMIQSERSGSVKVHTKGGTIIGIGSISPEREEGNGTMATGDRLYLYSDGILEIENSDGEFFGMDRLMDTFVFCSDKKIEDVRSVVLERIEKFSEGVAYSDDISILALEFGC